MTLADQQVAEPAVTDGHVEVGVGPLRVVERQIGVESALAEVLDQLVVERDVVARQVPVDGFCAAHQDRGWNSGRVSDQSSLPVFPTEKATQLRKTGGGPDRMDASAGAA